MWIHRPELLQLRLRSRGALQDRNCGAQHKARARIAQIHGFSGHAGHSELFAWVSAIKEKPRRIFVTHGEEKVAIKFAQELETTLGVPSIAPVFDSIYGLEQRSEQRDALGQLRYPKRIFRPKLYRQLVTFASRAVLHRSGFIVTDDLLGFRVPLDASTHPFGDGCQLAN